MMWLLILQSIYFIFPAYVANMLPVIFSRTKFLAALKVPVDFGLKLGDKPLLGKSKTVRGFVLGISGAVLFACLQLLLYSHEAFRQLSLVDYGRANVFLLGFLLGFGALLGDSLKSFVKRRLDIKPGSPFVPWDQIDYIIGALLFVLLVYIPPMPVLIILLIISPILNLLTNLVGYWLKLKDVWW